MHCAASATSTKDARCVSEHRQEAHLDRFSGLLKSLRRIGGTVSSDLKFASSGGGTAVFALRDISANEVLFSIPTSALLWRGPNLGQEAFQAGHLSAAENLVLDLAALKKGARRLPKASPIQRYAEFLQQEPPPNSTVLWSTEALAWLQGTEAEELTAHFLRRISQMHGAAPMLLEHEDVKARCSR